MKDIQLGEDAFLTLFPPTRNHLDSSAGFDFGDGGTLFETYGEELEFVRSQDPDRVWTLLECDGELHIVSGFHRVNRLGYFVCEQSIPDGVDFEVRLEHSTDETEPAESTINDRQWQALVQVVNYLADEETHFEEWDCPDDHIWKDREILRELIESQAPALQQVTPIESS